MKRLLVAMRWAALGSLAGLLWNFSPTFASGYFVPEMDAEAMGQGGAWAARARGASAIFFNPAGLTQIQGFEFSAGSTLIDLQAKANNFRIGVAGLPLNMEVKTDNGLAPPSHAYLAYKINDKLAAGIGMHTSFGLKVKWPQQWPEGLNFGSYVIEEVDLKTYNINPSLAYAINDKLSIGLGLQWVLSSAILETQSDLSALAAAFQAQGVPVPSLRPLQLRLDATGNGDFGFNVGLLYKTDKASFGLSYRSQVNLKLEGDADFTSPVTGIPQVDALLAGFFPDQTGSTEIPLPDILTAGLSYHATDKLELEADVNFTNWKDFEKFTIDFSKNTALGTTPILVDRTSFQDWKNGITIRAGGSYALNDTVDLRLGGVFDPTVIPEDHLRPLLPESDRFGATTGLGLKLGSLDLDLFYMYMKIAERASAIKFDSAHPEDPFNATYSGHAHLFGMTVSFGS